MRAYSIPVIAAVAVVQSFALGQKDRYIKSTYGGADFPLVYQNAAADVYIDTRDRFCVGRAAGDFCEDVDRVSGVKPKLVNDEGALSGNAVIAGTIGKNRLIDSLVKLGKIDVSTVKGKWECFIIQTVADPFPSVSKALVVAGSDPRGAIYGMFDISEQIGVSPWYWWADVTPQHKDALIIAGGTYTVGPPSVQYRGIFINDEPRGFLPWSDKVFEPGKKIGPQTYKKVFELLLRLRANFLWPAMKQGTAPFYTNPDAKIFADQYGIVMGGTHSSNMLTQPAVEWDDKTMGPYNYDNNKQRVYKFWEDRVKETAEYENIYTLGMRDKDDAPIPKTTSNPLDLTQRVIDDQRKLLSQLVNSDPGTIPQLFCPYKEVLDLLNGGLKIPNDVIVLWVDDNLGYIRQLYTNPIQPSRKGGVYYHVSYCGVPMGALWVSCTILPLVWAEMRKAYDCNSRSLWIVNNGNIKPFEFETEFFTSIAWDIDAWTSTTIADFAVEWAEREFGPRFKGKIADIMMRYLQNSHARKPTFFNYDEAIYSLAHYNEADSVLNRYQSILDDANSVYAQMPADLKDAFYELVLYQVRSVYYMVHAYTLGKQSQLYSAEKRAMATFCANRSDENFKKNKTETDYFQKNIKGGKWNYMYDDFSFCWWGYSQPKKSTYTPSGSASLGVVVEGNESEAGSSNNTLPMFSMYRKEKRFVLIYNKGTGSLNWTCSKNANWILLDKQGGVTRTEDTLRVSVDWNGAPKGASVTGSFTITSGSTSRTVNCVVRNPATPAIAELDGYVEADGYVSIEPEHYSVKIDRSGCRWEPVKGLGRTGGAMVCFPFTAPSITADIAAKAPEVNYKIYFFTAGSHPVTVDRIPTQQPTGNRIRYAVALDNAAPVIVNGNSDWQKNIMTSAEKLTTTITVPSAGYHTLKLFMVDAGAIIDKIVINTGGEKQSYLGPPESFVITETTGAAGIQFTSSETDLHLSVIRNPFRRGAVFTFRVTTPQKTSLSIYSCQGRKITELSAPDKMLPSTTCSLVWDGSNTYGCAVSPGIYLCILRAGTIMETIKFVKTR